MNIKNKNKMSRAVYCKCKNTYSIECKKNPRRGCKTPYYWKQGIGQTQSAPEEDENV